MQLYCSSLKNYAGRSVLIIRTGHLYKEIFPSVPAEGQPKSLPNFVIGESRRSCKIAKVARQFWQLPIPHVRLHEVTFRDMQKSSPIQNSIGSIALSSGLQHCANMPSALCIARNLNKMSRCNCQ